MIVQKGMKPNIVHKRSVLGAHPIINFFMEKMNIPQIIGSSLIQDCRLTLSYEKIVTLLIHNILTSPTPLYEIADWIKPIDEEYLGLEPNDDDNINDDRIGKVLEALYNSNHKQIFFRLALRSIKLFELDCSQIHQDTTTVTFSGKYSNWCNSPVISHGVNKDYRPDLKQLLLGMSVTADGSIPLIHKIYDGNCTDDSVHVDNHRELRKLLQCSDFIYVADCKLATDYNLRKIESCGGIFISVMPKTWAANTYFYKELKKGKVEWKFLLSKKNNRKPESRKDTYYVSRDEFTTEQGYRLLWIKSTQKAELDCQIRNENINKAIQSLKSIQPKLNKYSLRSKEAIKERIENILKEYHCVDFFNYIIEIKIEEHSKFRRTGRPKSTDKVKIIQQKYYTVSFTSDETKIKEAALKDGIFPLITNHKTHTAKKVLTIYKYQPFLEKRHSQLKTYQEIAPVYLKKSERVIAYLHIHVMALMVATLIERQLRNAMKKQKIKAISIYPEKRACQFPTTNDIVRLFKNVEKYEVTKEGEVIVFPAKLSNIQKQVLNLLEIPISLYR